MAIIRHVLPLLCHSYHRADNPSQHDAGPHELLDDPDMKALWQGMLLFTPELRTLTIELCRNGMSRGVFFANGIA